MGRPWALDKRLASSERHRRKLLRTDRVYKTFVKKATAAGLEVAPAHHMFQGEPTGTVRNTALVVNGRLCELHNLVHLVKHPGLKRPRVQTGWRRPLSASAHIFRVAVEGHRVRYFVVPRERLPTRGAVTLPVKKLPPSKNAKLDFWPYEEAWHLLRR